MTLVNAFQIIMIRAEATETLMVLSRQGKHDENENKRVDDDDSKQWQQEE